MKKGLLTLLIAIIGGFSMAQNNTAVISSMKMYDHGDGTGSLKVRISGGDPTVKITGTAIFSGDCFDDEVDPTMSTPVMYTEVDPSGQAHTRVVVFSFLLQEVEDKYYEATVNLIEVVQGFHSLEDFLNGTMFYDIELMDS